MNKSKRSNIMTIVATVSSVGLAVAFAIGLPLDTTSWAVRVGLLLGGTVLAGGSVALLRRRYSRNQRAAEDYFEALCRIDVCSLNPDDSDTTIPWLPPKNPWFAMGLRVHEVLEEASRRTLELKHTRTAWEIRFRRATAELEQIKAIFSGLADPVIAVDEHGDLSLANHSAEKLFQFHAESPTANGEPRELAEIVPCQRLVDLLTTTVRRKAPGDRAGELEIADADGDPRWYRATASKLKTPSDSTQPPESNATGEAGGGAVVVLRDIGDQKALQKRNAEFVSAASHEMKTPLAGIKAYVELLLDGDAKDERTQEEFLNVIDGQADRLQRLVENLLNLARIEAGVVEVVKDTRSLNELLSEAIDVVQPAAEAKNITLTADLSPMYLGVLADRDMLLQSAINLLSNAIKYTPNHGTVTLRSRMEGDQVRFEVQDTGVGLSAEDCGRVFDKFYRVAKDNNMADGTGLGLPLAKHIVEDVHGGQLAAQSVLGEGSTFAVTIPSAGQLT